MSANVWIMMAMKEVMRWRMMTKGKNEMFVDMCHNDLDEVACLNLEV